MNEKKTRLLIVEDSQDLQVLNRELFESEGYEVLSAFNGQEALEVLREKTARPDLILLDLMMPVMDGPTFREKQLADPDLSGIPVIVLTADGNAHAKAARLNAADSLNKTTGLDELLQVVRRNCR
ncbi:MAG: response regulator [Candidatus Omnitrophota bacterium]